MIGIFKNKCPRCHRGEVFSGLISMRNECSECHYPYTKESGYFLGAMFLSTIVGAGLALPTLLLMMFGSEAELSNVLMVVSIQILVTTPFLFRLSRLLWMYLEFAAEKHNY